MKKRGMKLLAILVLSMVLVSALGACKPNTAKTTASATASGAKSSSVKPSGTSKIVTTTIIDTVRPSSSSSASNSTTPANSSTPVINPTDVIPTIAPTPTPVPIEQPVIAIGDYIVMGQYYDTAILWRCVDIDENGPLILSDKIITEKAFDATGTHTYLNGTAQVDTGTGTNTRLAAGSNLWQTSHIRSWLNSSASAGNVAWVDGTSPIAANLPNFRNAYAGEKGFLADGNFTENERNAIKAVTQKSMLDPMDVAVLSEGGTENLDYPWQVPDPAPNYDVAYYQNVTDQMFLLDIKQAGNLYVNRNVLGGDYYIGQPTQQAVDNSEFKRAAFAANTNYDYTLRTPDSAGYIVKVLTMDGVIRGRVAAIGTIRPAFYLNTATAAFQSGNGSLGSPYVMQK